MRMPMLISAISCFLFSLLLGKEAGVTKEEQNSEKLDQMG